MWKPPIRVELLHDVCQYYDAQILSLGYLCCSPLKSWICKKSVSFVILLWLERKRNVGINLQGRAAGSKRTKYNRPSVYCIENRTNTASRKRTGDWLLSILQLQDWLCVYPHCASFWSWLTNEHCLRPNRYLLFSYTSLNEQNIVLITATQQQNTIRTQE